jgi:PAS domain S-box-containing protein
LYSQIETADASSGVLRSSKGLSIADVERNAMKADLKADLILNCFSRKWRLLIVGDPKDYTHTSLQVNLVVCVAVGIATVLICALVLFTIARNHQKLRLSDTVISKLEELDAENITDRKKAEDKLSEMNRVAQDLRLLIDTANVPCFGIDKEGKVNEWNKKSAELVGYTADEVIGRDLVQDFINPEFRNAVRKVLDDALKGLITSSFEFYFFSKTGVPIELLLNANPRRSATGDIVGVLVISQDMTEKRKSMETEIDLSKVSPRPKPYTLNLKPWTLINPEACWLQRKS